MPGGSAAVLWRKRHNTGMKRSLSEDEQHKIAGAIVEHLEQSNWKIEKGAPREGHGPPLMSK
jgi:hypothetical protein